MDQWRNVQDFVKPWIGYIENLIPFERKKPQLTVKSTEAVSTSNVSVKSSLKVLGSMNAAGGLFIKLAGLHGALAVSMGAYGAHAFYKKKDVPDEQKKAYETANHYHFLHTLALLAVPLTNRPLIVGTLIGTGMTIFCGTCYFYALTGKTSLRKLTPYGGILLIIGWLSMVL